MYKFSLMNENNLKQMADIQTNAYPSFSMNFEEYIKTEHEKPNVKFYSVEKDDKMVGSFNIWDFEMNMRGSMVKAGGIGSIAVDLAHKKEKVCKEMMINFFENLKEKKSNVALLYAFNTAFYHKMGFGFGTLLHQFKIKPDDLPGGRSKAFIRRLSENDSAELTKFYNSKVDSTHGLIKKYEDEFTKLLKNPKARIFAYVDGGVKGYIIFTFKQGSQESHLVNDIIVREMLFDSPEVFAEIMAFLKSQSDQIRYIVLNMFDEGFINTIADPRNHTERILFSIYQEVCQTGLGFMYRICDVEGFFADIKECKFGDLNLRVKVNVSDTFISENNKPFLLEFTNGKCKIITDTQADVELNIGIAEFSSLMMGCTNLKLLVKYGKAVISDDNYLDVLSRSLGVDEKPVCLTHF